MKKQIGMMAVIFSLLIGTFASAEDLRLTINQVGNQAGVISWPGETGAIYRVYNSTDLQEWQWVATTEENTFAFAKTGEARFFRVQKVASSLTVARYSVFGDQTVVAGVNNFLFGSFIVSAGSAEAVSVSSFTVTLSAEEAAAVTNMRLDDGYTAATLGTVKNVPDTVNIYSVSPNVVLAANGQKVINLFADVRPGANVGIWQAQIDVKGYGVTTGILVSSTPASQAIQTMNIISSGTLTVASGNMPNSEILIAGSTGNYVAQYKISAANEGYTVDGLKLTTPYYFALSTANVTVKYMDKNGVVQQSVGQFFCESALPCVVIFTGLNIYVPANGDASVDVYVDMATLASGGFSGAAGAITLLANRISATGDSGSAIINPVGWGDLTGNTFTIRKSKPTFAKLDAGTDPVNGPMFRFSVVADAAGDIDLKQLSLTVNPSSGCSVSWLYLYDPIAGIQLTDVPIKWGTNGIATLPIGTADDADVSTIGAATTKTYEVWGTVTGYEPGTGAWIYVKFANDASPVANSSAHSITVGSYNVWSDRSATAHTVFTPDWCNGYLLKGMDQTQTFSR